MCINVRKTACSNNLISQSHLRSLIIISCPKSVSSANSVDQMKQPKSDVSLQPFHYTIYSLMVFLFEKHLTDNLKTCGLIFYKNIPKYK